MKSFVLGLALSTSGAGAAQCPEGGCQAEESALLQSQLKKHNVMRNDEYLGKTTTTTSNPFQSVVLPTTPQHTFHRCPITPGDTTATVEASVSLNNFFDTFNEYFDSSPKFDSPPLPSRADKYINDKETYHKNVKELDIAALYDDIKNVMLESKSCWPADGPQDGDFASYAGLFVRSAWHCAGTYRNIDGNVAGGCEGGLQRFWPENEWHDNVNVDKFRALLDPIKEKYGDKLSWGDLMTFAGTVAIKASGGPANHFCFGRVDSDNGFESVKLQVDGVNGCAEGMGCQQDKCYQTYLWPDQDPLDHPNCNSTQVDFRYQGAHGIGLIYVHADGPLLKKTAHDYKEGAVHNRSPRLSALDIRDTFTRMGWNDSETVALIAGGHTLGRCHGACSLVDTKWGPPEDDKMYNGQGPWYEAVVDTGRGPTDGTCGPKNTNLAGLGPYTISSGFEGAWTETPSQWTYDYLKFTDPLVEKWSPVKSPFGADQFWTANRSSPRAHTMRLTTDLALFHDATYAKYSREFMEDDAKFDEAFAYAWKKLVHRSANHPKVDDLEHAAQTCTDFSFLHPVHPAVDCNDPDTDNKCYSDEGFCFHGKEKKCPRGTRCENDGSASLLENKFGPSPYQTPCVPVAGARTKL